MVSTQTVLYIIFIGLLGIERAIELAVSRRNARRAFARGAIEVGHAHYRAMAAFHTFFLLSCVVEALCRKEPFSWLLSGLAFCAAMAAQALRYWAIVTLGERWNVRIIVVPGDKPVTGGPYRFLRHPNYLAVVIEMACVPLILGNWRTALLFSVGNALLLHVRIRAEEGALGDTYKNAFAHRARLIPGRPGV